MTHDSRCRVMEIRADRPGFALLIVMLVTMVVAAIAAGAALIGANTFLINEYDGRRGLLETVADAGLELNRARMNADPALYNDTAIVALEVDAAVTDAGGAPIPGVTRTVYALPVGGGAGQFGNFATLVSIARDGDGAKVIRRLDLVEESFATFAYFTHHEPTTIAFGLGDQLYGPVHSNSKIEVRSTGATFHGPVTTADRFIDPQYATFHDDTASGVPPIPMPTASQLDRLRERARPGHMTFSSPTAGGTDRARMRIEFVSRSLDGSAARTGFIRVYTSTNTRWVTGNVPTDGIATARQCGRIPNDRRFRWDPDPDTHLNNNLITTGDDRSRCFLGGADTLWTFTPPPGMAEGPTAPFYPNDGFGQWMAYPGGTLSAVSDQRDAGFLFPLDRTLNPGFRGVIFVDGSVVVSGRVRGRVTLVATGNIIIGDDVTYDTDPGAGTCRDALGLIAGGDVVVADNMLNSQQWVGGAWRVYDETPSEFIHATILALGQFLVQGHDNDPAGGLACNDESWGRGCLHINGGIIQHTRGPVGMGDRRGYGKQYTFDQCAFTDPPPYFPGIGRFHTSRYYEIDPTGFDIQAFFNALN